MNGIPLTAPPLPPVTANPVQAASPQIPDESGFLHAQTPSMPDMSGLSTFGQAVKKYMGAQSQARGQAAGQAANEAAASAGHGIAPEVQAGAFGTPPPFGGGPPSLSGPPQGGP